MLLSLSFKEIVDLGCGSEDHIFVLLYFPTLYYSDFFTFQSVTPIQLF